MRQNKIATLAFQTLPKWMSVSSAVFDIWKKPAKIQILRIQKLTIPRDTVTIQQMQAIAREQFQEEIEQQRQNHL